MSHWFVPKKPFSGLRDPYAPIAYEGPPIYIILIGHADGDGSLTYVQIDSCWDDADVAQGEVKLILQCKPPSIRDRFTKSINHPNKWVDNQGHFIEIQKHERRIPLEIHKKSEK